MNNSAENVDKRIFFVQDVQTSVLNFGKIASSNFVDILLQ